MLEYCGWLLDMYEGIGDEGVVLWVLGEDGQRHRLQRSFPVTFYAAGPAARLRSLWRYLEAQPEEVRLSRQERRDLFSERPLTVLAAEVAAPSRLPGLFRRTAEAFPDLTYFDADIPLALRFAAAYAAFPLTRCRVTEDEPGSLVAFQTLDSPWDLDLPRPPLRTLTLEPDDDPAHTAPRALTARCERYTYRLTLQPERPFLINLRALLKRHDPDLLLTLWGDTWLLPYLINLSQQLNLSLPLNRDEGHQIVYRPERSYFSYGQVIYRGQQVHLYGRWHIDAMNAVLYHDYGMEGILELARVTSLPVQTAARVSPGTGISAMQILTALRQEVLVPWHKQQAERPKTALEMVRADQGGLVFQPTIGLHRDVAEIDFISMYPSIMAHFNISPETVGMRRPTAETAPELEAVVDQEQPGLVPQTLQPLLDKRLRLKSLLISMPHTDPRRKTYQAYASAHKWLLVTCFGYLGYKNARFGRIEAHEAVTAYGREALLRAKEAAEALGFRVLHMYVDGLWVRKPGATQVADFQPLVELINESTGLPIALDGIYRWVAFLPSRQNKRVPVANRYFGVFQDNTIKMRGIETRRRDTPAFIAQAQDQLLKLMAHYEAERLSACLPQALALLRRSLSRLRSRRVPLQELVISEGLSRELEEYRSPSPAAEAAGQLQALGRHLRPGQRVRFIFILGDPRVYAWDLPEPLNPARVDVPRYEKLLVRAASAVLEPLRVSELELKARLAGRLQYRANLLLGGD